MNPTPEVSVVMAVRDSAETLPETMDSILAQRAVAFEVVIIDDCSTDETAVVLSRYATRDPRVRVIRQASNRGLTQSLIIGCSEATAPLIARHDAGDLSLPTRLAAQKALLDSDPRTVLVSCWTQTVGPCLEPMTTTRGSGAAESKAIALIDLSTPSGVIDGPTHHGSAMFRTQDYQAAGGYRAEFYYGQDWDLWFRLAQRGLFRMVPEVLYVARITPSSISATARQQQQSLAVLAREALVARSNAMKEDSVLTRAREVRPAQTQRATDPVPGLYFIGEALRRNGDVRARHYLRQAVLARPTMLRAWLRWMQSIVLLRRSAP